jgi:hypothetical protein
VRNGEHNAKPSFLSPTGSDRMNTTAGAAKSNMFSHQIDQLLHSRWTELAVAIDGQNVRIVGECLFAIHVRDHLHYAMTEQVVHVHHLQTRSVNSRNKVSQNPG